MSDTVHCDACNKVGKRQKGKLTAEGWFYLEASADGDTTVTYACSVQCALKQWKIGPGRLNLQEPVWAARPGDALEFIGHHKGRDYWTTKLSRFPGEQLIYTSGDDSEAYAFCNVGAMRLRANDDDQRVLAMLDAHLEAANAPSLLDRGNDAIDRHKACEAEKQSPKDEPNKAAAPPKGEPLPSETKFEWYVQEADEYPVGFVWNVVAHYERHRFTFSEYVAFLRALKDAPKVAGAWFHAGVGASRTDPHGNAAALANDNGGWEVWSGSRRTHHGRADSLTSAKAAADAVLKAEGWLLDIDIKNKE